MPTIKYGITFESRISAGLTGVENNISIVPRSHSRAITSAVRNAPTIVITITTSPGIKYHVEEFAALNQSRTTGTAPFSGE